MQSPDRLLACVVLAGAALLAACAEGSTIDAFENATGGDGGASGDGGRSGDGGAGDGGDGSGPSTTGNGSATSSATGLSSSASTSTGASSSTGSSTSASSTAGSTSASSTAASSTSSTGGGAGDCEPLEPALDCGGGQHCVPAPAGEEPMCTPAGGGSFYDACFDNVECGPTTECVDVGDFFASPCCLQYCRSAADCETPDGSLGTCYFATTPIYADGVEYGICYDDLGGC